MAARRRWRFRRSSRLPGPQIPAGQVPVSSTPGDYGVWPRGSDHVFTAGANLYLNSHVVVKADYQHFSTNSDFSRIDLGLGVSF